MANPIKDILKKALKGLKSGQSLAVRTARGGLWLGAGTGIEHALRLARNMVIARIIAPEAFGVMAIVLAVNAAFESFTNIGLKSAVIHDTEGSERTFLNGAWWVSMARSTVLYAAAFLGSPLIGGFYGNPELDPLLKAAFLSIIFNGALSPALYVSLKKMDFKRWSLVNLFGSFIGVATALILVFFIQDVWALVAGYVAESFALLVLSYVACPFMPDLRFEKKHVDSILKYAKGVFGLPILTNIFMQADVFVIGKLCTPAELGIYSVAAAFAKIPFQMAGNFISQLSMPAFSEMQDDNKRSNSALLNITSAVSFLVLPPVFLAILYSRELLSVLYGSKYSEAYLPFAILTFTTYLRIINVPIVTYYFSIGKPEIYRIATLVRAAAIIALIYPAVHYFELIGAAAASLASMVIGHAVQVLQLRSTSGLDVRQYASSFVQPAAVSAVVTAVWLATHRLFETMPALNIAVGVASCVLSYSLALFIKLNRSSELYRFLDGRLNGKRKAC